jgi:hypothetical protein
VDSGAELYEGPDQAAVLGLGDLLPLGLRCLDRPLGRHPRPVAKAAQVPSLLDHEQDQQREAQEGRDAEKRP